MQSWRAEWRELSRKVSRKITAALEVVDLAYKTLPAGWSDGRNILEDVVMKPMLTPLVAELVSRTRN